MTVSHEDRDLRSHFEHLRESSHAKARSFEDVLGRGSLRGRRRVSGRRVLTAGAVAVLAVTTVAAIVVPGRGDTAPGTADVSPNRLDLGEVTWRGPTDFLLDTPGREFLLVVPTISVSSIPDATPPGDSQPRSPDTIGRGGSGP